MSRTALRRTSVAAVTAITLLSLSACGGGEDTSADDPAPASSSSTIDEQPSEEPTEEAPDAPSAGEEIDPADMIDVFRGAFENATTATLTMRIGDQIDADGVADFAVNPPEMRLEMTLPQAPDPIDLILVDGFVYSRFPGMGDGKFTKTALDDPASPFGQLGDQLDLRTQFEAMEESITAATYVGEEDGLEHYSLVLDSAALAAEGGTPTVPGAPATFTYDLFFDADGYLRRMESDPTEAEGDEVVATYDAWGEPVEITAPPADQVSEGAGF